jgi:hypothetical protein
MAAVIIKVSLKEFGLTFAVIEPTTTPIRMGKITKYNQKKVIGCVLSSFIQLLLSFTLKLTVYFK